MKICLIEGCGVGAVGRGYCQKHYKRLINNGSPHIIKNEDTRFVSPVDRIMARVVKDKKTGCWNFTGRLQGGYGYVRVNNRFTRTHRIIFEHHNGKIPEGMLVCHSCDNPKCCNPEHLWLGTHNDNMNDMTNKDRGVYLYGEKHSQHKLKEKDVLMIRKLYNKYSKDDKHNKNNWCTIEFLAKEFNMSYCAIRSIIKNVTWRNLKC